MERLVVILPDVNVLVYAHREECERHLEYRAWLEGVYAGNSAFGVSDLVLSGCLRVLTHAGYSIPLPLWSRACFRTSGAEHPLAVRSHQARDTGGSSANCAKRPALEAISWPTPSTPPWPSSREASGSPPIATTPGFQDCAGVIPGVSRVRGCRPGQERVRADNGSAVSGHVPCKTDNEG